MMGKFNLKKLEREAERIGKQIEKVADRAADQAEAIVTRVALDDERERAKQIEPLLFCKLVTCLHHVKYQNTILN